MTLILGCMLLPSASLHRYTHQLCVLQCPALPAGFIACMAATILHLKGALNPSLLGQLHTELLEAIKPKALIATVRTLQGVLQLPLKNVLHKAAAPATVVVPSFISLCLHRALPCQHSEWGLYVHLVEIILHSATSNHFVMQSHPRLQSASLQLSSTSDGQQMPQHR